MRLGLKLNDNICSESIKGTTTSLREREKERETHTERDRKRERETETRERETEKREYNLVYITYYTTHAPDVIWVFFMIKNVYTLYLLL